MSQAPCKASSKQLSMAITCSGEKHLPMGWTTRRSTWKASLDCIINILARCGLCSPQTRTKGQVQAVKTQHENQEARLHKPHSSCCDGRKVTRLHRGLCGRAASTPG